MPIPEKPKGASHVVLREESDDWAVLFNPEDGGAFGLNPVSRFIWERLDGNRTLEQIEEELKAACADTPENVSDHIRSFVGQLDAKGLIGEA